MSRSKRTIAELALIFDTLIWGLTFPFIRLVVAEISPIVLNFWRGTIATLILGMFVLSTPEKRRLVLKTLPAGCLLGVFFYLSYLTQSIGLETIQSGRSAFITNLSVVLVPLLSPFFKSGRPTRNDMISSFIAFIGLILLTDPLSQTGIRVGDIWTLGAAFCFSIQIHLLQIFMKKYKAEGIISFVQVLFIGVFGALCLPIASHNGHLTFFPTSKEGIFSLLYLAGFATVLTIWLQSRYQYETTPERAAVIYVLEPVFATMFGFLILRESMSFLSFMGAIIMICAVLWVFLVRLTKHVKI